MTKRRTPLKEQNTDVPDEVSALIEQARVEGALSLDLSFKELTQVPASVGNLTQLQSLNLSYNNLTHLPEFIGNLTQLQGLYLWNNKLVKLPEFIGNLTQLQGLDLSGNNLTHLPEFIGNLTQLQSLYLSDSKLVKLPEAIGRLSKLTYLYLDGNRLTTLPASLRGLKNLEQLYLHGNKKLALPAEVLGRTWHENFETPPANPADILDYYFRTRGEPRPLNEAKLILIGRGGVGKTSIVNRLVHGKFGREKKTEGINITEWPIRLNEKEDVRLNVWDFGGQEIMHSTHQFFLTERSLYLIVVSGREGREEEDAEYWLRYVESFGADSPAIVVLNKSREHPSDVNRRALQQKFPFIREFIKTDCKDGLGLDELRRAVERETDRLESLRDKFPANWFGIKDRLARMRKSYLSFAEYRSECARLGEENPEAQKALATYLHRLGIALNYREDPRLQDTHVLNPHWVTDGIYKIINSKRLEQQKGDIRLDDLSDILDARRYPPAMHPFVLDLMKKFELCFSFPGDEGRFLVPQLLDVQEPEETAQFDPARCLNFQYHYPVLPEGVLPRFIVRTHALSEGRPRWRTGAILEFEGCRALVKADVQDKRVFVNVSGPARGRRRLLAVIRSDFDRIHGDIRNLKPQEMVPLPEAPAAVVPYQKLEAMEREGVRTFPEYADGRVLELDVRALLDGVDLEETRRRDPHVDLRERPVRLFYSYSHKDEVLRNELETHLKILQRRGLIDSWHDRKIEAGDDWRRQINVNLERADIVLLLVSADFIASDYCHEVEMKAALERQAKGETVVLPVILRDVNLNGAEFSGLQYLPKGGKAVTLWDNKDSAWRNVSEGIEKVAARLREKRGQF
ncbi:MAG TPA: COR domain-containing protein [Pyrinomonadaceae bacterium]|nr:COR domain-containing protein [Pyrinomonadaceae bacterium]